MRFLAAVALSKFVQKQDKWNCMVLVAEFKTSLTMFLRLLTLKFKFQNCLQYSMGAIRRAGEIRGDSHVQQSPVTFG